MNWEATGNKKYKTAIDGLRNPCSVCVCASADIICPSLALHVLGHMHTRLFSLQLSSVVKRDREESILLIQNACTGLR